MPAKSGATAGCPKKSATSGEMPMPMSMRSVPAAALVQNAVERSSSRSSWRWMSAALSARSPKVCAEADEHERHARETELVGREQVREDDRRGRGRRLGGRLADELPTHAPGNTRPQTGRALNRSRLLDLLYDRTTLGGTAE